MVEWDGRMDLEDEINLMRVSRGVVGRGSCKSWALEQGGRVGFDESSKLKVGACSFSAVFPI